LSLAGLVLGYKKINVSTILLEKNKGRQLGKLEFAAYDGKKKIPEPRLKGYAG
jgi:hypothetical protein